MRTQVSAARPAFFYLLVLVGLGFTGVSTGKILFEIINASFPEAVSDFNSIFSQDSLRFAFSSVIVAAPIYWYASHRINEDLRQGILAVDSRIRKWMTYLLLLVAVMIMMGSLIGLLNTFLSGELTTKFILKVFAAFVIAGLVFSYYGYDLKRTDFQRRTILNSFTVVYWLIIFGVLVSGFQYLDPPTLLRMKREDQERIDRLSIIQSEIDQYYQEEKKLPDSLQKLEKRLFSEQLTDPVTGAPFSYEIISQKEYRVCGDFSLSNEFEFSDPAVWGRYKPYPYDGSWKHGTGKSCFERKVYEYTDIPKPPVM